jgi:hypothetical protein
MKKKRKNKMPLKVKKRRRQMSSWKTRRKRSHLREMIRSSGLHI